ncbi:MAG: hypothetical protein LBH45_02340 [Campylobacteraceae bacterium]|nr:hypothetical protein [Campylobacteraceae bacterium]
MKDLLKAGLLALTLLFLTGCGGGGGSSGGGTQGGGTPGGDTPEYTISFYDDSLDLIDSTVEQRGNVNITSLADDLGIISAIYPANSSTDITGDSAYEEYNLIKDVNFYTVQNVQEVTDQAGLNSVRDNLIGKYILLEDIPLNDGDGVDATEGWLPIGDNLNMFTGIFNGNGYKITNLWIDRSSTNYVGLFGFIRNAQIKNLGVEIAEGKSVTGLNFVGGIAGNVFNSATIQNSYATGSVSGNSRVGGIAGSVETGSAITNSYTMGSISGNSFVGGIAGNVYNSATIQNSYAAGSISGTYQYVGGIAGYLFDGSTIQNSAAINPSVTGTDNVNRVVGYIRNDYGVNIVSNNFALDTMSVTGTISGNAGTSKTDAELKTQTTYEDVINGDGLGGLDWSFGEDKDNPWKIDEGSGYPYLYWQDL